MPKTITINTITNNELESIQLDWINKRIEVRYFLKSSLGAIVGHGSLTRTLTAGEITALTTLMNSLTADANLKEGT